jgi:hypothetical protein
MLSAVRDLAGDALTAELDKGLAYERAITLLAFAVQLIAVTQAREKVGVIDDPTRREQRLETIAFPERPNEAEQERLAGLLMDAAGPSRERYFARVLATQGLAGLDASAHPHPAVVISLEQERDRRRGSGS